MKPPRPRPMIYQSFAAPQELFDRLDRWRATQPGDMRRPEAIRQLVDAALTAAERAEAGEGERTK